MTQHEGKTENGQRQVQVPSRSASRELDALIAEKVMGWRTPRGFVVATWHLQPPDEDDAVTRVVPSYSTDIAAAWLVVEKLRCTDEAPDEVYWSLVDCATRGWRANLQGVVTENDGPYDIAFGVGETLPLAICRAALAAVGALEPFDEVETT